MASVRCLGIKRVCVGVFAAALCFPAAAFASWTNLGGGDHGGAAWTITADTTVAGIHTNISVFTISAGVNVSVQPFDGAQYGTLQLSANTITIHGTLSANGSGYGRGQGPGGVTGGFFGTGGCGEGGGGGGGGGVGGSGGGVCGVAGPGTIGGASYGSPNFISLPPSGDSLQLGSGGGGGNGGLLPGPYWAGGGSILLSAMLMTLNNVSANGLIGGVTTNGNCFGNAYVGGSGGGSGGTIVLAAKSLSVTGTLAANGGNGQPGQANYCFQAGGGGGGAGGRIKLFYMSKNSFAPQVDGGSGGAGGNRGGGLPGSDGADGTIFELGPLNVGLDIKPGSFPNSINLGSNGATPVAILGSATLDVSDINLTTLTLGTAGIKTVGKANKLMCSISDVSGDFSAGPEGAPDGFADLVCHFITVSIVPEEGGTTAKVSGDFNSGGWFEGTDSVNLVP